MTRGGLYLARTGHESLAEICFFSFPFLSFYFPFLLWSRCQCRSRRAAFIHGLVAAAAAAHASSFVSQVAATDLTRTLLAQRSTAAQLAPSVLSAEKQTRHFIAAQCSVPGRVCMPPTRRGACGTRTDSGGRKTTCSQGKTRQDKTRQDRTRDRTRQDGLVWCTATAAGGRACDDAC